MLCKGEIFLAMFWSSLSLALRLYVVSHISRVMSLTNLLVSERWFLNKVDHVKEVLETD